ncbi:hypothetical protein GALMADRAFT_136246 [Galerina marginata CBS 339.88]|uniref:Uncharacterized protein n=1 Tax=Galerina marginata (strain CBS 339.88) TaxID=685588 RepID=A0A067TFS0_GALM3|nr:hypothetical protein GALMADRAFT_136246 [Galerina marginata CBS 339.88]
MSATTANFSIVSTGTSTVQATYAIITTLAVAATLRGALPFPHRKPIPAGPGFNQEKMATCMRPQSFPFYTLLRFYPLQLFLILYDDRLQHHLPSSFTRQLSSLFASPATKSSISTLYSHSRSPLLSFPARESIDAVFLTSSSELGQRPLGSRRSVPVIRTFRHLRDTHPYSVHDCQLTEV